VWPGGGLLGRPSGAEISCPHSALRGWVKARAPGAAQLARWGAGLGQRGGGGGDGLLRLEAGGHLLRGPRAPGDR